MRPTAIAVLLGLLSACTADGPYSAVDPHLETTTHASSIHTAGRGPQSQTRIRAIVIDAPQSRSCTLLTYVVRSDLNFPKIKAVRSHGRPLAYRRIDRHRAGRLRAEAGTIAMSCSAFARLTGTGHAFRLYGPRGTYDAVVPGRLFSEALSAAGSRKQDAQP